MMMKDETFERLRTVFSINALHILMSDILHTIGSMNRPRLKGKDNATVVRKVTSSEGYKYMFNSNQLEDRVSCWM